MSQTDMEKIVASSRYTRAKWPLIVDSITSMGSWTMLWAFLRLIGTRRNLNSSRGDVNFVVSLSWPPISVSQCSEIAYSADNWRALHSEARNSPMYGIGYTFLILTAISLL